MGNTTNCMPAELKSDEEINLEQFSIIEEREDTRYGRVYLMKSNIGDQTLYVKQQVVNSFTNYKEETAKRFALSDESLLKVYQIKRLKGTNMDQIYFEEFLITLEKEIEKRKKSLINFTDEELWNLLICVAAGLAFLEKNKLTHGYIVPANILKSYEEKYKIDDNFLLAEHRTTYNACLNGKYTKFLPPELVQPYLQKSPEAPPHNIMKADIFTLGLCVLDAGVPGIEGNFINRKNKCYDKDRLDQVIKKFLSNYESIPSSILEEMLSTDPEKRPTASLLLKKLSTFSGNALHSKIIVGSLDPPATNLKLTAIPALDLIDDPCELPLTTVRVTNENNHKLPVQESVVKSNYFTHASPAKSVVINEHIKEVQSEKSPDQDFEDHEHEQIDFQANKEEPTHQEEEDHHEPEIVNSHTQDIDNGHMFGIGAENGLEQTFESARVDSQPKFDINAINLSEKIKNDPILSEFVKKIYSNESLKQIYGIANPLSNQKAASPRVSEFRTDDKDIQIVKPPSSTDLLANNYLGSRDSYLKYTPMIKQDLHRRGKSWASDFSVTGLSNPTTPLNNTDSHFEFDNKNKESDENNLVRKYLTNGDFFSYTPNPVFQNLEKVNVSNPTDPKLKSESLSIPETNQIKTIDPIEHELPFQNAFKQQIDINNNSQIDDSSVTKLESDLISTNRGNEDKSAEVYRNELLNILKEERN